jgi:hypothetical protein
LSSGPGSGSGKPWEPAAQRRSARALADLAADALQDVFARRAGMAMELAAAWPEVAGLPHGEYTLPQKILWPRRHDDADPFEPGTLVVACDGGRAVFFQHDCDAVIERVNAFFGFDAVARIRIVQKPLPLRNVERKPREPVLDAGEKQRLAETLRDVSDPGLRDRLARLGAAVIARNRK